MKTIIPEKYIEAKDQKPMVITYKEGKKIITHPSGVISKYDKTDLQQHKDRLLEEKTRTEEQIARIDSDITECGKAKE